MIIEDGVCSVEESDIVNGELRIPKEVTSIESYSVPQKIRFSENFKALTFEEGSQLKKIGDWAFINSSYLEKIDFSNCKALKDIGAVSFRGCGSLEEVNFSGCECLEYVGFASFKDCDKLKKVDFSRCSHFEQVEGEAFFGCAGLISANFSGCEHLKTLGESVFEGCSSLEWVDFNNCRELSAFKENTFYGCGKLVSVDMNNCESLEDFEAKCFYNCKSLKRLNGFDKLGFSYIGTSCFENSGLEEITFPKTKGKEIQFIVGSNAFIGCKELKSVRLEDCDIYSINPKAFAHCDSLEHFSCKGSSIMKFCDMDLSPLDTIDLRNVTGVEVFDFDKIYAKNVLLSGGTNWKANRKFFEAFSSGTQISICNNKGEVSKQFTIGGKNLYEDVRIGASFLVRLLEAKGVKMDFANVNNLRSEKEVELFLDKKNIEQYDDMKQGCLGNLYLLSKRENFIEFLRKLGYFGFEDCATGKVDYQKVGEYKKLLARNLVQSKIKKDIRADINKGYIDKIINEKVMKVARTHSLNDLVYSFVMNNIASSEHKEDLFEALDCVKWTDKKDIDFAQFLVLNFDEIMNKTVVGKDWKKHRIRKNEGTDDYSEFYSKEDLHFDVLFDKFQERYFSSNKKIVTRSDKNRFTLDDFLDGAQYVNVTEENKELAEYCSKVRLNQYGFEYLSDLLEKGMAARDKQVLKVYEDEVASGKDLSDKRNADLITYKVLEKGDPLGLVLGNLTNCCQKYGGAGEKCMVIGATDVNSSFMTINKGNKILAQGWIWYDPKTKTVAIDNIEVPEVLRHIVNRGKKDEVKECIQRFCDNAFKTMNENGYEVKNVIIGADHTDVIDSLNENYVLEDNQNEMISCPFREKHSDGTEEKIYSDVTKSGQFVVYKDGQRVYKDLSNESNMDDEFERC